VIPKWAKIPMKPDELRAEIFNSIQRDHIRSSKLPYPKKVAIARELAQLSISVAIRSKKSQRKTSSELNQ